MYKNSSRFFHQRGLLNAKPSPKKRSQLKVGELVGGYVVARRSRGYWVQVVEPPVRAFCANRDADPNWEKYPVYDRNGLFVRLRVIGVTRESGGFTYRVSWKRA